MSEEKEKVLHISFRGLVKKARNIARLLEEGGHTEAAADMRKIMEFDHNIKNIDEDPSDVCDDCPKCSVSVAAGDDWVEIDSDEIKDHALKGAEDFLEGLIGAMEKAAGIESTTVNDDGTVTIIRKVDDEREKVKTIDLGSKLTNSRGSKGVIYGILPDELIGVTRSQIEMAGSTSMNNPANIRMLVDGCYQSKHVNTVGDVRTVIDLLNEELPAHRRILYTGPSFVDSEPATGDRGFTFDVVEVQDGQARVIGTYQLTKPTLQ